MGTNTVDLTNSTTTMEKLSILRSEKLKLLNPRYFPGPNIRDVVWNTDICSNTW